VARPLRIEYEGAFYHVTSWGNERRKIFFGEPDYEKFKSYLKEAEEESGYLFEDIAGRGVSGQEGLQKHGNLPVEAPDGNDEQGHWQSVRTYELFSGSGGLRAIQRGTVRRQNAEKEGRPSERAFVHFQGLTPFFTLPDAHPVRESRQAT
jgi:hypothetical protein